jgi:hypothetical protein
MTVPHDCDTVVRLDAVGRPGVALPQFMFSTVFACGCCCTGATLSGPRAAFTSIVPT